MTTGTEPKETQAQLRKRIKEAKEAKEEEARLKAEEGANAALPDLVDPTTNGEAHEDDLDGGQVAHRGGVTRDAQIHMEDEFLDDDTTATLLELIGLRDFNRAASRQFNKAGRDIKKILPLDNKDHRSRVHDWLIKITANEGGQHIEFTRKPGHRIVFEEPAGGDTA